jgi:hypothetical protein
MRGELSHDLPALVTSGNRILRSDTMQPVLLRGVNRSGLEYSEPSVSGFLAAAGVTENEIREIVLNWRASVIRLPFNQEWALRGRGRFSAEDYLASLDQVISWAAELGAYTILDLQWLDPETVYGLTLDRNSQLMPNHIAPTPDADSILLWTTLAARYRDEPAVLFDLFNEPHDPLDGDFLPIHVAGLEGEIEKSGENFVGAELWTAWAGRLINEVRRIRTGGLILVEGIDWGFDLRGIHLDVPNIVYSTHIYSNRRVGHWHKAIGRAAEVPLFIGEWGGEEKDLAFGRTLADRMRRDGLGWTAWSWVDYPRLVERPGAPDYRPTAFGDLVRSELRASAGGV